MKHIVIGTFLGFVCGAAFLAACGGTGDGTTPPVPPPISTPSAAKWSPMGPRTLIATGIDLSGPNLWSSTAVYENGTGRNQYAAFEIRANVEGPLAPLIEIGMLPALDGTNFGTEPQVLGTVQLRALDGRRATLSEVRVPPVPCKLTLRLLGGSDVRVLTYAVYPYNEELQ